MTKAKCRNCGKPVLPGSDFCSNSCDAGFVMNKRKPGPTQHAAGLADCLGRGMISMTVRAVEFSPKPDGRGPSRKNKPTLWEARISDGQNGDAVAKRPDPDEALRDALSCFANFKKPVTHKPEEDDGLDLI